MEYGRGSGVEGRGRVAIVGYRGATFSLSLFWTASLGSLRNQSPDVPTAVVGLYASKNGKSRFSSSWSGLRPYSQISKASANWILLARAFP